MNLPEKRNAIILILVATLFFIPNAAFSLDWGSRELETEMIAIKLTKEVLKGDYDLVSTEELKKWYDAQENLLVVDTMPFAASYAKKHLPGAVQFEFPIKEVSTLDDNTATEWLKVLGPDKDQKIVIYCGFTKCGRSHNGAMWAKKLGYKNVYRYPGGIKAWDQADFPIEAVE